jgi:hypothetical protein
MFKEEFADDEIILLVSFQPSKNKTTVSELLG